MNHKILALQIQRPKLKVGRPNTVELQWLKHRWLIYRGCFELVLESV